MSRKSRPVRVRGMRPESLMMSYGYQPANSHGAIKPPLYQTSTFVFPSAQTGKEFFAEAYGLRERDPSHPPGLIYSRLSNPDLEILESRLNLWDEAEASAVFASGMAAISTTVLALVGVGEAVVFGRPVYGGTDYLFEQILPQRGVPTREFPAGSDASVVEEIFRDLERSGTRAKMVFLETPANPTMLMTDIESIAAVAHEHGALVAVDNTFLGPLYQRPLRHGADLVLYSATKYLGGHSDLLAGVVLGPKELIDGVRLYRTILGSTLDPHTAWLLLRSLETAKLRITCARKNAEKIALWLSRHPKVTRVHFPGLLTEGPQKEIYDRQCTGPGAMLTFEIAGADEEETFRFLDAVRLIRLAVSLGGTESLIEHPATMTHADVPVDEQREIGITPGLVRLSVGIEHPDDLVRALDDALATVGTRRQSQHTDSLVV